MTVVILTEIENAKVLTKLFTRRFYFLLFLLRVFNKDFSSQTGDTNFVEVLPLK